MACTVTVNFVSDAGDSISVRGTVSAISGTYTGGAGNGEPINFGSAVMAGLAKGLAGIPSSEVPIQVAVWPTVSGVAACYNTGATRDAGKVRFFSAFNTEVSSGAYAAPLTSEAFQFEALFRKLV